MLAFSSSSTGSIGPLHCSANALGVRRCRPCPAPVVLSTYYYVSRVWRRASPLCNLHVMCLWQTRCFLISRSASLQSFHTQTPCNPCVPLQPTSAHLDGWHTCSRPGGTSTIPPKTESKLSGAWQSIYDGSDSSGWTMGMPPEAKLILTILAFQLFVGIFGPPRVAPVLHDKSWRRPTDLSRNPELNFGLPGYEKDCTVTSATRAALWAGARMAALCCSAARPSSQWSTWWSYGASHAQAKGGRSVSASA